MRKRFTRPVPDQATITRYRMRTEEVLILRGWGKPCEDYCPECCLCQRWRRFYDKWGIPDERPIDPDWVNPGE